ncbi:MAG TPA: hypothetical protein VD996_01740 [Chitinophagaceae bacterium]|nr:hypothetical protein [Chitinophagaceae bacterium]
MAKANECAGLIISLLSLTLLANNSNAYHFDQPPTPAKDSVVKPASLKYRNMNFIKRVFLGKNYRDEWATPVKMPVFDIKKVNGGFTIVELGGGQQTKSLRLKDKNGVEWVLRTVDKDVEKALQPQFRKTFVRKIVQDMVSASHPYAPLTIPELARAANVVAPRPVLYFIPDDPALGEFRSIFANQVCMLEEREPTPDRSDTENTEDVLQELMEENDHLVMQEQVLRARLLDMLIADWDRHADQWRWGQVDSGDATLFYVIPRDRDFAYFNSGGLLTKIVSTVSIPHMRGFTKESKALKKLNAKTWFFDHNFLNELDAESWKRIISEFQQSITDSVIHKAVTRMPPEVYAISGREIESKLRSRRDGLLKNGMKYYEELAASVHVMGTDKSDFFHITGEGDNVTVSVYNYNGKDTGMMVYRRVFKRNETYEINLEGFGENDHFEIDDDVSSRIRLRISGGDGKDSYTNKGKIRKKIEGIEVSATDPGNLAGKRTALSPR